MTIEVPLGFDIDQNIFACFPCTKVFRISFLIRDVTLRKPLCTIDFFVLVDVVYDHGWTDEDLGPRQRQSQQEESEGGSWPLPPLTIMKNDLVHFGIQPILYVQGSQY